jgi:hypothetical protein
MQAVNKYNKSRSYRYKSLQLLLKTIRMLIPLRTEIIPPAWRFQAPKSMQSYQEPNVASGMLKRTYTCQSPSSITTSQRQPLSLSLSANIRCIGQQQLVASLQAAAWEENRSGRRIWVKPRVFFLSLGVHCCMGPQNILCQRGSLSALVVYEAPLKVRSVQGEMRQAHLAAADQAA